MKKITRLTENDLNRLVKKVVQEQSNSFDRTGETLIIQNSTREIIEFILSKISEFPDLMFLVFEDCEFADFRNADLCSIQQLRVVSLKNTPSNLERVVRCKYEKIGKELYDFSK